jgi:ADP-ribose pyrophosphatase YjhB (NUDIX family)
MTTDQESPPVIRPPRLPSTPPASRKRERRVPTKQSRQTRRPVRREVSAGGVVVRQEGQSWLVALLKTEHKRGQVWVLPKGHVELHAGERIAQAARREVQEEAGLQHVEVKNQLGVSRFSFQAEGTIVKKTVHYFLMITQQTELTPQAEEGLLEARWFPLDEALAELTYDTDQLVVRRAKAQLLGEDPTSSNGSKRVLRIHT